MRRVRRQTLPDSVERYLAKRQSNADLARAARRLDVDSHWKASRSSKAMQQVFSTLRSMAGARHRCMYCLDSDGSDIEHFRPKAHWPGKLYVWTNLLLCCTVCGRLKGDRFPVDGRRALLIDPTREDPWESLDFDPMTGNLTARFDCQRNDWSDKGRATVQTLHLDQREALARGYLKTWRRLSKTVDSALTQPSVDPQSLWATLAQEDDHGLLGWCFTERGATLVPFATLHHQWPEVWRYCKRRAGKAV